MHLRDIGVEVLACSSPREVSFLAERSDVLIVLTDCAEVFALADALRAVEKLPARPVLIVLGAQDIPWTPRSTTFVLFAPLAFLEWPAPDIESERELPFTD